MSYRLIDANALNGVISNDDYEKVLNAPCIFADLPNGLDGEHYNLQEPVLDKIRAEIETKYGQCDICEYFEDYDYEENDISEYRPIGDIADILQIIDKYKGDKE